MSVTLRKRKNLDGTISLRLDIYRDGQRYIETLTGLKLEKPSSPLARENNKRLLRQAEAIRVAKAAELEANEYSLVSDAGKRTLVIDWLQDFAKKYTKKDVRNMQGVIKKFEEYLKDEGLQRLTFNRLDGVILDGFIDRLNETSKGEGAASYLARLKKAIKPAYKRRLMKQNPFDFCERKPNAKAGKKEILTIEEIKKLANTHTESDTVRRAALFSAMTGLAWIDIKGLKWAHIDLNGKKIRRYTRSKTDEAINVNLNDTALKMVGEPGEPDEFVFDLPTANGANKTLKAWVKRAKIDKKITWHNLRHSAGTNLAFAGTDILTISKILAHSSTKHTIRYVDAAEEMKITATDKLNIDL